MLTYPNHHDTAVLVKKHDICTGSDDCGSVGLADVVGCCGVDLSWAICEDTGLVVITLMAHETDHCRVLIKFWWWPPTSGPMPRSSRQCHGIMVSGFTCKLLHLQHKIYPLRVKVFAAHSKDTPCAYLWE
jgi:hypothetical protein